MKSKRLILGGVVLVLLIGGLVAGLYYSTQSQPDTAPPPKQEATDAPEVESISQIDDAEEAFSQGLEYFGMGDYDKAEAAFQRALELDSGRAAAVHHNLGVLKYQQALEDPNADIQDAVDEFKAALEEDPDDPDSHYQLGATYLAMAQPTALGQPANFEVLELARAELEKAMELAPDKAEPLVGMGHYYMTRNELANAIEALEKALELDPDLPEALFALGNAYAAAGKPSEAKEALEKFLDTDPPKVRAEQAEALIKNLP